MAVTETENFSLKEFAKMLVRRLIIITTVLLASSGLAADYTKTSDIILDGDKAVGKVMLLSAKFKGPSGPNSFYAMDNDSEVWEVKFNEGKDKEIVRKMGKNVIIKVECRMNKQPEYGGFSCQLLRFISQ